MAIAEKLGMEIPSEDFGPSETFQEFEFFLSFLNFKERNDNCRN